MKPFGSQLPPVPFTGMRFHVQEPFILQKLKKKTEHRNEVLVLMCCFPWKIVTLAWKNADITKNRNEWTLTTIFCKTKYDSLVSHHISSFSFIPGKC